MEEVVIVSAARTPVGKLMGALSAVPATELGAVAVRAAVERAGVEPRDLDEVIMGNCLPAGLGQNPARQAAIYAGISSSVAALTVNKVCASALKAVALAAQAIKAGDAHLIVAGGLESMSRAPYLSPDLRFGKRHGDAILVDSMIHDGLWDCYKGATMGALCELTAERYKIPREEQDAFALRSHQRAVAAMDAGKFREEIVPVKVKTGLVDTDEPPRRDTSMEKLARLKPAFKPDGTITAGNAPGLNDAAAALLVASRSRAEELGLRPMARIEGYASGHVAPEWFPIAPTVSVRALLAKTGLRIEDFDLIEENEAFASQAIAVMRDLGMDPERVNVHGGAIALGHPIGASGARILVTLLHALKDRRKELGLASLCLGGGGSVSMAVRML
ncbi:MAG: acetyl-CoA C-acetyltransferase [Euryarchaeota archaeon]|nr:acetyl-CoA C-acetyltransferase [Euryarchaeota archaeon]